MRILMFFLKTSTANDLHINLRVNLLIIQPSSHASHRLLNNDQLKQSNF